MEHIKLVAEGRSTGKGQNNRLRREGKVPAVVYGKKVEPQNVVVNHKDLERATTTSAGFNALFDLSVDGKRDFLVRIGDYQAHPLSRSFVHVDFQAVDISEKIEVDVPVEITGSSPGVKEGGVLELQRRTLHLRCLVSQIPEKIPLDISALNIGDNIHANDIKLPEGVEFPHDTNFTVVSVVPPKKEEEPTVAAEAALSAADVPALSQKAPEEGAEAAPAGGKEKEKKEKEGKK